MFDNTNLDVKFRTKQFRPILETTFIYENIEFKVFNNHWPSKAVGESYRLQYAKDLQEKGIFLQDLKKIKFSDNSERKKARQQVEKNDSKMIDQAPLLLHLERRIADQGAQFFTNDRRHHGIALHGLDVVRNKPVVPIEGTK